MYVDIFFDTKPTEEIHPTKLGALYAVKQIVNAKGTYWHALVTEDQYANRIAKALPALTWDDAIKTKAKIFKKISADVGGQKDCPEHVFGVSVFDPKVKKIVVSSGKADISTAAVVPVLK